MHLQLIKRIVEQKNLDFKGLALAIGMSEGNLHRCVRENKIQAGDLEKISNVLGVSISIFFDNPKDVVDRMLSERETRVSTEEAVVTERLKRLEDLLAEKDKRIKEKDERISELKERIEELKNKN